MRKVSWSIIALIGIVAAAVVLRFYRLDAFTTFLADQGRDAIIMKRIVTFEHFPAIGPPSSIGMVMLGPFYYYLISPFLWLFHLNPIGMSVGVAFFSIVGLIICYYFVRKESNLPTALIFATLVAFSAVNIMFSRFSWNPNLLPIFAFVTLTSFYLFVKKQKQWAAVLAGFLFALSTQLHHLAFLLGPILLIYFFLHVPLRMKKFPFKGIVLVIMGFILGSMPLIIFDIKHQFLNSKLLINLFTNGDIVIHSSLYDRFVTTVTNFFTNVFVNSLSGVSSIILFLSLLAIYLYLRKQKKVTGFADIHFISFFVYIILFSLLNSQRLPHYFASVYYSFFFIIAYLITLLKSKKSMIMVTVLFLIVYILLQSQRYYYFTDAGNYHIESAERIAKSILVRHPQVPYQVVGLPFTNTDEHIRYFLEVDGPRPLAQDTLSDPKELYVLCHELPCQPLADPQWQIAAFTHGKISGSWKVDGITIYKDVREK